MSDKYDNSTIGRRDWAALLAFSEDEIEQFAVEDEDNPGNDERHWAQASVGLPPGKTAIHASFDRDIVA